MGKHSLLQQNDPLLLPFLQTTDEAKQQHLFVQLIAEQATFTIKEIIRYKLRINLNAIDHRYKQDAEDIYSEVLVQLLIRLRRLKTNPEERPINNFSSYVAVVTYRACYKYLREKYPLRYNLKDKVRHFFTNQDTFSLWQENEREWFCGFAAWRHKQLPVRTDRLQQLLNSPRAFEQAALVTPERWRSNPQNLLSILFTYLAGPVNLDDLVDIIAGLWGINALHPEQNRAKEGEDNLLDRLPDPHISVDVMLDQRTYLQRLWQEVCDLPLRQRVAVLLNLKDGEGSGIIALFPLTGIATIAEIASALSIPLTEFAHMWQRLPLDDETIATYLALTRQQVINLRKSARERLARRMKAWEEKG